MTYECQYHPLKSITISNDFDHAGCCLYRSPNEHLKLPKNRSKNFIVPLQSFRVRRMKNCCKILQECRRFDLLHAELRRVSVNLDLECAFMHNDLITRAFIGRVQLFLSLCTDFNIGSAAAAHISFHSAERNSEQRINSINVLEFKLL